MPIFQWNVVLKVVEEPVMGALEELFNIFIHCLFTFTNLTRIWLYYEIFYPPASEASREVANLT